MSNKAAQVDFLLASQDAAKLGTVTFYAAGTTTLKTIYLDRGKATPAANPYTLDANGTAQLYADGIYKAVVKNAAGSTVYTRDNLAYGLQDGPWVDVAEYASLTAAVAAIGATETDLLVDSTTTLTANTTVPATLRLNVTKKGRINQGAYTLTISSAFSPLPHHIFTGSGTIANLKEIRPEWFGSPVNQTVLQAALDSALNGSPLDFTLGLHTLAGGVVAAKTLNVAGHNATLHQTGITAHSPLLYIGNATQNGTPHPAYPGTSATFAGALTAGQTAFTVADSTGLNIGDPVMLFLGQDPYDNDQHFVRYWRKISNVAGNVVTVNAGIEEAVSGTFVAGLVSTHRIVKFDNDIDGVTVENLHLKQTAGIAADPALFLLRQRNASIENVTVDGVYAGAIGECENVTINNVTAMAENGFDIYGVRNFNMSSVIIAGAKTPSLFLENQVRGATIENVTINVPTTKENGPVIAVYGGSKGVHLKDFTIYMPTLGTNVLTVDDNSQGSEYITENFTLLGNHQGFHLANHTGYIAYKGVQYRELVKFQRTITLTKSMSGVVVPLPEGLYKSFKMYVKSKTGLGDVALFPGGYTVKVGATDYIPAAGTMAELSAPNGAYTNIGTSYPWNDTTVRSIWINTDGTVTEGNIMVIEIETFTNNADPTGRLYAVDPATFTFLAAAPTFGSWGVSNHVFNSVPSVGQPKGWICTVAGGAYSVTRANTTAYALAVWGLWTTGTTVWEVTTAGTTAGSAPSIVGKVVGDTVVDGTVTWTMRSLTAATFVSEGNL